MSFAYTGCLKIKTVNVNHEKEYRYFTSTVKNMNPGTIPSRIN